VIVGEVRITTPARCDGSGGYITVSLDGRDVLFGFLTFAAGASTSRTFPMGQTEGQTRVAQQFDVVWTLTASVQDDCGNQDFVFDDLKLDVVLVKG
jgi:hypothetical protein